MNSFHVYILTNKRNGTLYVGVTNDIARRINEHRIDQVAGFTRRHELFRLVYFESCDSAFEAISREKQLKRWKRQWKLELIESVNPYWRDISDEVGW